MSDPLPLVPYPIPSPIPLPERPPVLTVGNLCDLYLAHARQRHRDSDGAINTTYARADHALRRVGAPRRPDGTLP